MAVTSPPPDKTEGEMEFGFGRVDGTDIREVGWPFCGELDIMEMVGGAGREKLRPRHHALRQGQSLHAHL